MLAWIALAIVVLFLVLIIVKVIQLIFGLLAIALIVVGFFIVRDRVNEWLARR